MTRTDIDNYQRSSVERAIGAELGSSSSSLQFEVKNTERNFTLCHENNELRREIINRANMNKGPSA